MTDRELLELAAKAAGLKKLTKWSDKITDWDSRHHNGSALHAEGAGGQCISWNPLTDDGDALRLAVKLNMEIDIDFCEVRATAVDYESRKICESEEEINRFAVFDSKISSLRRVIVCAAAEIGKTIGDV